MDDTIGKVRAKEAELLEAIAEARAKGYKVEMIYLIPSSQLPVITIVAPGLRDTVFEWCP